VIKQLGLGPVITGLSGGMKTSLSVGGHPLSQGEAIRLVLARSLIARPSIVFIDGLLDRLSDSATLDVLQRLKSFESESTIVISTGRNVIAQWADRNLDIGLANWVLVDPAG
jgi:putative ABC transport system ATP-binding protein